MIYYGCVGIERGGKGSRTITKLLEPGQVYYRYARSRPELDGQAGAQNLVVPTSGPVSLGLPETENFRWVPTIASPRYEDNG